MLKQISYNVSKLSFKYSCFISKLNVRKTHENLVEVDPIFPDLKQSSPSAYKAPHRAPLVASERKIERAQIMMGTQVFKKHQEKIYKAFRERKKDRGEQTDKVKFLERFAKEISVDPSLHLPYGFHFDEYIIQNREEAMKKETDKFEKTIYSIYDKLKVRNEFELSFLYKHAFSVTEKDNFKEKARKIVLQKFLKEIAKIRKKDGENIAKSANKYFEDFSSNKEFYLSSLKDIDVDKEDEIFEKFKDKIKAEQIEETARILSVENFEDKIQTTQAQAMKEYKPGYRDIISFDPFFFGTALTTSDDNADNIANPKDHKYSFNVAIMNEEEFEQYQLWRDVKKNYFKNKIGYFKKIRDQEGNQEKTKKAQLENDSLKIFQNEKIEDIVKKMNLEDFYQKPNFEEIYSNIDQLVLNLPIGNQNDLNKSDAKSMPNASPSDYLWDNITNKFERVIPKKYYNLDLDTRKLNTASKIEKMDKIINKQEHIEKIKMRPLQPTLADGDVNYETISGYKFEEEDINENVLKLEEQVELEVFRHVRKDPFFQHHLVNSLKYYSERMVESGLAMRNLTSPGQNNKDYLNYIYPADEIKERQILEKIVEIQQNKKPKINNTPSDKFFSGGRKKTAHAMAVISPGRGVVTVNHLPFYEYFNEQYHRSTILTPIDIAQLACTVNVDLYVRGGGISAQVSACKMALARCIVKRNPLLKSHFKRGGLIKADNRQVERKHVGHYKARKKFPYQRR